MLSPQSERIDEQRDGKQREEKSVIMGNTTESTFEEQDDETGTRAIERAVEVVRTWFGKEELVIHEATYTREEKQRDARLHWVGGGRRRRRNVPYMQHLPQERRQRHARLHWLGGGRRQRRNVPCIMQQVPQERRNSAMQECTGWEGTGGGGGTCHTSCSIFHNRGETAPCEIALVGRGQEAEEERVIHHAESSTREKKQRHARIHWRGGGRRHRRVASPSLSHQSSWRNRTEQNYESIAKFENDRLMLEASRI
jgi:hypothetical protein